MTEMGIIGTMLKTIATSWVNQAWVSQWVSRIWFTQEVGPSVGLISVSENPQPQTKIKPILIVHGGAGGINYSRIKSKLNGVKAAAKAGQRVLFNGGNALEAVVAAVNYMEDDVNFNAGYGSVLNLSGEVEMDASIMSGTNLDVGAVALVRDFKNPISIAYKVLTDSPHNMFGGHGVKLFALEKGFKTVPPESLISDYAKDALRAYLTPGDPSEGGTVGAVAIDAEGHVAAATSTGGLNGKAVGRIGDSPQIGSGTYADDRIGGVSCTGHGESISKFCLAHAIIKLMENGAEVGIATKTAVDALKTRLHKTVGAIAVSSKGEVGYYFASEGMSWAYIKDNTIYYGIEQNQVLQEPYR